MAADPEKADPAEMEEVEEEEEEKAGTDLSSQILRRPDVLAALQGRLHAEMLQTLPAPVKRRIKALKKLQFKSTEIEARFYYEVHKLECKYHEEYKPLHEQRHKITSGTYEPNDEESEWPSDEEDKDDEELSADLKNKAKIEEVTEKKTENENEKNENIKGVPDFWLTIFKNVALLAEMIQEHDEPILKQLEDVRVIFKESDPMGFVLEFCFSANDYFTNTVLTKEYEMKCKPDESDPFGFEGPEIYKCKGCHIDWKKGKNVTIKTIKKKQKHKARGAVRVVLKTIQNDSFFNFFSPPSVPDDSEAELDDETQALLTSDFEIGHYIRERIVPRAVLYFTGEALDDEDYEEEEGEEGEEEDEDDPEFNPGNNRLPPKHNPADCKQQ